MHTYLETERLTLRRFTSDDAELLISLDSDPAVMRYLPGGEPTPPEVIRERDLPSVLGGYDKWHGQFGVFAAHLKISGEFVGWFHLRPEQGAPQDEVELGYRLRQCHWGKGYATEVSSALLDKGFAELGVRSAWAATMSANSASQRVMERIGMEFAEAIPTPPDMQMCVGAELGGVLYIITEEQWQQRSTLAP